MVERRVHKLKGKQFELRFTQMCIFHQKNWYLGNREACGDGWLAGIFFFYFVVFKFFPALQINFRVNIKE